MAENKELVEMLELVDQFIDLANRMVVQEKQALGMVGAAIRYAAARFNAHEASTKMPDLAAGRDDALDWFTNQYREMLLENLDEHIALRASERQSLADTLGGASVTTTVRFE